MHVGTFGAPVGLKGEIRINCLTKTIQVFKSLNEYFNFDKSTQWKFDKMLIRNNKLLVHPSGFNNRNDVELLINKKIYNYALCQVTFSWDFYFFRRKLHLS